jgi:hypothetical protein
MVEKISQTLNPSPTKFLKKPHSYKLIGSILLSCIALLLILIIKNNSSKTKYIELWLVDTPFITQPFDIPKEQRFKNAKDLQHLLKEKSKELNQNNKGKLTIKRKFNSSIIHLESHNEQLIKDIYSYAQNGIQPKIKFGKLYNYQKYPNKTQEEKLLKILTLGYFILLLILWLPAKWKKPQQLNTVLILLATITSLLIFYDNFTKIKELNEVETKVKNDLIPFSRNYMLLYASNTLKAIVGELTGEMLESKGYKYGINMVDEDKLYRHKSKETQRDSLWIKSNQTGRNIIETKMTAEKKIKDLLKSFKTEEQTE